MELVQHGVFSVLAKPFAMDELQPVLNNILQARKEDLSRNGTGSRFQ